MKRLMIILMLFFVCAFSFCCQASDLKLSGDLYFTGVNGGDITGADEIDCNNISTDGFLRFYQDDSLKGFLVGANLYDYFAEEYTTGIHALANMYQIWSDGIYTRSTNTAFTASLTTGIWLDPEKVKIWDRLYLKAPQDISTPETAMFKIEQTAGQEGYLMSIVNDVGDVIMTLDTDGIFHYGETSIVMDVINYTLKGIEDLSTNTIDVNSVADTDLITNLNADLLDGLEGAAYLTSVGLNTEAELESQLGDVTDVYTNNDGVLQDDEVTNWIDNVTLGSSGSLTIAQSFTVGEKQWSTTYDEIDGEQIYANTIDEDSIDFGTGVDQVSASDMPDEDIGDITITTGAYAVENDSHNHTSSSITLASTDLTDTADIAYVADTATKIFRLTMIEDVGSAGLGVQSMVYGRDFDASSVENVTWSGVIPYDFVAGTDIVVKFKWCPTVANSSGVTKYVMWDSQWSLTGEDDDCGTSTYIGDWQSDPIPDGEDKEHTHIESVAAISGASVGEDIGIRIFRRATDAGDTYAADAMVFNAVYVEYTAEINQ